MKTIRFNIAFAFLVFGLSALSSLAATAQVVVTAPVSAPAPEADSVPGGAPGQPIAIGPDGKPIVPGQPPRPGQPGRPMPPGGQPAPTAGDEKSGEKKEANNPVTRPNKPSLPPDPRELKVVANPDGKLRFSFHGQAWADVLEWLAAISGMSLDWQELPSDYLNLVTQREYSVPEARDLINRHLLARGFTMLVNGEVLSVVNLQKLNPGMVPRVEPEDLATKMPNEYLKVSFPLAWMMSEKAVEELKPMLSPNAKLTALKNTNRIEAIDSAINLREVHALLMREQSGETQKRLVKKFALHNTRATDVLEQLKTLLGIESKPSKPAAVSPEQMEAMQQQQQMMQQMQRQGGQPAPQPKKDETVNLVANTRENSILAHAPPDKMEVIAQAIEAIDVEADQMQSLLTNVNRIQVYRLHGVEPDALVKSLLDIGQLEPATRLEVDSKNKAIIAYASLADHMTIKKVVERLDGSGRKFEVIPLRRLEADYVAGTIEFMMLGPQEEKQQQPRYFDFYSSPSRSSQSTSSTDKFRVDADVDNNRLLLWANEIELQEVTNLLVKLGEVPPQGGRAERLRVLDSIPADELPALLERLRRAWPSLSPNSLELPAAPNGAGEKTRPRFDSIQPGKETRRDPLPKNEVALVSNLNDETEPKAAAPATKTPAIPAEPLAPAPRPAPPAVQLSVTPDGRIVIASDDTQALDLLEELIAQTAPARRDYQVYALKHADAFWVKKNLEDFFKEGDSDNPNERRVYYYDNYAPPEKSGARQRLSKRKKLRFIYDVDTNSILVQGADASQQRTIEELIQVYDQPQESDSNSARVSAIYQVRFSKASTIAAAVKDLYRDLLSSNDKALANNPEQKSRGQSANTYIFNEEGTGGDKERTRVTFKGKLSLGIDDVTNTLLISTEGENLMRNVSDIVKTLDESAKPLSSISVIQLNGQTNTAKVREVLSRMLGEQKPAAGQRNPGQPANQPMQPQPMADGETGDATPGLQIAPQ